MNLLNGFQYETIQTYCDDMSCRYKILCRNRLYFKKGYDKRVAQISFKNKE